ncbi:MAG: ABC transporter substrate-binding protein [Caldilinea sp.]|uniref:ABC transporter substrate-binding protein n=1 Tax=Caldilinea sp. TaxID=2293560 RepID=UPI002C130C9E|nr:amino acid ABC transporter substrate-binding protein [Anaerolineales bacterium]HQY90693.1 ABC transporter substrate-binding protein [Caldilinea sp.]
MKKQVVVYLLLVVALLALSACTTVQPTGQGADAPAESGMLAEIQAAGKLVVGTSADYAPYESIDADGNFVGFDMDLIRAVGEKLGVEVEIQDMPFDSLIASVQEGKIDAVIAAMQATAERDQQVDFTIPYRMTKDAFVGAGDATLVIEKPEDAAGISIGAQTGTVQEGWIQTALVDTGLTAADQVFSYERADQAALDVANGRIQLLLMDAEPSIALADETGLKILLITELTAEGGKSIAIPDGASDLKAELDRIIQELLDDGTVQKIQETNGLP